MNQTSEFWFPVKRYGWGWGPPVCWQGWLVVLTYVALLCAGIYCFRSRLEAPGFLIYVLALTAALGVVVALKGERPVRWRWGE